MLQPVFKRSASIELMKAFPGANHRLLLGVFRIEKRAKHPVAMAYDGRSVCFEILNIGNGVRHDLLFFCTNVQVSLKTGKK